MGENKKGPKRAPCGTPLLLFAFLFLAHLQDCRRLSTKVSLRVKPAARALIVRSENPPHDLKRKSKEESA